MYTYRIALLHIIRQWGQFPRQLFFCLPFLSFLIVSIYTLNLTRLLTEYFPQIAQNTYPLGFCSNIVEPKSVDPLRSQYPSQ